MFTLYIIDARYGVNGLWSGVFLIGGFVVSAVIYVVLKMYRQSKGVAVDKVYGTIPVE